MPVDLSKLLCVGISSRALFHLEDESRIYERLGLAAYREYQIANESEILRPGTAFQLIKGLLALNTPDQRVVEVIVVSRNNPETGLRIFNSIAHYGLDITRAAFLGMEDLAPQLEAFSIDLFLSSSSKDALEAIDAGIPAAVVYQPPAAIQEDVSVLRIAFDGDAVLFSEESEAIYRERGLDAFLAHESANAMKSLPEGPFAKLLVKLGEIQRRAGEGKSPIRLAIVTARNSPAHERVIRTLRAWGVHVDQAFFLGGVSKDEVLRAYKANIFFDDQEAHLAPASYYVPCALVPYKSGSVLRKPKGATP